jgi:hypothetical protein
MKAVTVERRLGRQWVQKACSRSKRNSLVYVCQMFILREEAIQLRTVLGVNDRENWVSASVLRNDAFPPNPANSFVAKD